MLRNRSLKQSVLLFSLIITIVFFFSILFLTYFTFRTQAFQELANFKANSNTTISQIFDATILKDFVFYSQKLTDDIILSLYWQKYKMMIVILAILSLVFICFLNFGIQAILRHIFQGMNDIVAEIQKKEVVNIADSHFPAEFSPLILALEKSEQQLSGMNTQNEKFRAFASHELRNELTVLLSLMEQNKNKDVKTIQRIHKIKEMVDDLLLLSYYPNHLKFYPVDVLLTLATLVDSFKEEKEITLEFEESPFSYEILATERLLTRCLYNIIHNAVQYHQLGTPINITINNSKEALIVTVENIADAASFSQKSGHGIGLELVKHIMQVLQGYFYKEIAADKVSIILSFPKKNT